MSIKAKMIMSVATIALGAPAHAAMGTGDTAGTAAHINARTADIQDIVVTARRREESLQAVPVAVSAASAEILEERGIRSVEDLRMAMPGLNITGQRRDEASFFIRGQGPSVLNFGQRNFTSVATYFAEVPAELAGSGNFHDLASVQVLKGPQGTLFGRNTTGGAVLFEPQRPTFEAAGTVKLSAGNYDYRDVEAVLNIPVLNDLLAIRLAGTASTRDGYTTSIISGQKLDERTYHAYRASVLFTPSLELENLTIIDRTERDQAGTSGILRQTNPNGPLAAFLAPYLAQQQQLGPRKTLISTPLYDRGYTFGVTNKTTWEVSENITLKNIVAFRKSRTNRASDYDATPVQTITIENTSPGRDWQFGQEQFTEEFQVQGNLPSLALSYIVGYYHETTKPGFDQEFRQNLYGNIAVRRLDFKDRSNAVFAHVEWGLSDSIQLSGGFRQTWDERRASVSVFNTDGECTQRVPAGVGPLMCPFSGGGNFKASTYDATLQYTFADQALVYASYRHGYKSGGINLPSPSIEFTAFDPEYVDQVEIGLKADWYVGMPIRTNIAAFIDKYKDIQISSPVVIPNVAIISLVQNAAKATNKGIEFEGTIQPHENLTIGGFLSYLDSKSDVTVPGTTIIKGRQTAFQPKWKYGVNARLELPTYDSVGQWIISADYSWQSRTNTNEAVPGYITTFPSYGLLNARVELNNIAGSGVDLAIFSTNLTNKTYILGGFPLASSLGFDSALYGEPRMYGLSAKVRF